MLTGVGGLGLGRMAWPGRTVGWVGFSKAVVEARIETWTTPVAHEVGAGVGAGAQVGVVGMGGGAGTHHVAVGAVAGAAVQSVAGLLPGRLGIAAGVAARTVASAEAGAVNVTQVLTGIETGTGVLETGTIGTVSAASCPRLTARRSMIAVLRPRMVGQGVGLGALGTSWPWAAQL